MTISNSKIKTALLITPSNIGDVILALPVLDNIRHGFPQCKITMMTGPLLKEIFKDNPYINKLIIYDKYSPLREKIKLFFALKKENFDLVVDLRNTFFGLLLPARFRTSPFLYIPPCTRHMKEQNLYRLQKALKMQKPSFDITAKYLFISQNDKNYVNHLLEKNNIRVNEKIVIIAAAAGGANRRWEKEKFAQVASGLSRDYRVILVGRNSDRSVTQYICEHSEGKVFDFAGLTSFLQLAYLIEISALVLVCDTGVLQLASYMDTPILALFGASDEKKYGPWSKNNSIVISRELFCRRCHEAQCRFGSVDCMHLIKAEEVLKKAKEILRGELSAKQQTRDNFKRILIVRTDRIGDVLLSTPVIKTLRCNYPDAYIAMMVSPYAKDIVEGNPYLDKVIIYDKDSKHKSWWRSIKFSHNLKKKKFDLAIILHPTNRVHLVTFFAGIPKRVGYGLKLGFLLTDRIKHTKQFGEKHELEYNLDLVRYLGIPIEDKSLFMPIKAESEKWVDELFKQEGIKETDKLLAIHPGASCSSKIWPNERFAEVADRLTEKYGFKVIVVAGPKDIVLAQTVARHMQHAAISLAGKTSVSRLASILKRCRLFISNDSGPVHIGSAVGVPVISIFGRNQAGLSPRRWGPTGKNDRILHKEVGCIECLAHNCVKDFICLKSITVDDVLKVAEEILTNK